MAEFNPFSLPYKEFIRFLNGGEYLDTFEVGSRTIDPISWPTQPRKTSISSKSQSSDIVKEILERPWIDPEKFKLMGPGFKKENQPNKLKNRDENKRVTKTIPWQPTPADEAQVANKIASTVKKMSNKDDEIKLTNSKRKLRQQYELIENEKKRRRIQVIEFQKPQPPQAQSKKPPVKKQQCKRPNQLLIEAMKLHSVY